MGNLKHWLWTIGVSALCAQPVYGQAAKPASPSGARAPSRGTSKSAPKKATPSEANAPGGNASKRSAPSSAASAASAPSSAIADAQARFRRALELHDEGNLDAARTELQRAYEKAPNFRVLFNLAQVEFELLDYPAALATFQKYLDTGGDNVPADRRAQVQADIEKLRGRVAQLEITVSEEGAQILVDDIAVGTAPLAQPVVVSAGRRRITVNHPGFAPETRLVEIAGGDHLALSFELEDNTPPATEAAPAEPSAPPPPVETPPPAPDRAAAHAVPWLGWGATAVLAGGAAVTGALALKASTNLENERAQLGADRGELDRLRTQASTLAIASDVCAGAAAFAGLLSLYFTVTSGSGTSSAQGRTLRVAPSVGFVSLDGTF